MTRVIQTWRHWQNEIHPKQLFIFDFASIEGEVDVDKDLYRILVKYGLDDYLQENDDFEKKLEENLAFHYKKKYQKHRSLSAKNSLPNLAKDIIDINVDDVDDWAERHDLRNLYTVTIDPKSAKDFDDAISLRVLSQKKALLYIHIADLSYFVQPHSFLDVSAQTRAFSHYLSPAVVPMLPHILSENLCSLVAGVNRLCVTVELEIDIEKGLVTKSHFYRSMIRVDLRYNYEEAEQQIHAAKDRNTETLLLTALRPEGVDSSASGKDAAEHSYLIPLLWRIVQKKRDIHLKQGRLYFYIYENEFEYAANAEIKELSLKKAPLCSNLLVEECMLSANIAVAEHLKKQSNYAPFISQSSSYSCLQTPLSQ